MPLMPPSMKRAFKQGISYRHRLDEYSKLEMKPLLIKCFLKNAYIPADNNAIHLDSLLSCAVANDVRTPALKVDGCVFPIPIKLLWKSPQGFPLWASSDLKPNTKSYSSLEYWHKKSPITELIDWSKRANAKKTEGATKEYRVPMHTVVCKELHAYAIGDKDEVQRLLDAHISHVGKKTSQGFGYVKIWEVSEILLENIEDIILENRPVPTDFSKKENGINQGWTPPYWDARRFLEVA